MSIKPHENPFPRMVNKRCVINELCTCGHFRTQHFTSLQFGHANCMMCEECKRFTWRLEVLSTGSETFDEYMARLSPFNVGINELDEKTEQAALDAHNIVEAIRQENRDLMEENCDLDYENLDLQQKIDRITRPFEPKEGEGRTILVTPKQVKRGRKKKRTKNRRR